MKQQLENLFDEVKKSLETVTSLNELKAVKAGFYTSLGGMLIPEEDMFGHLYEYDADEESYIRAMGELIELYDKQMEIDYDA